MRAFLGCSVALFGLSMVAPPASAKALWEEFSGDRALDHVQHLVALGPRPAASAAIEQSRVYLEKQLQQCGWQVARQVFIGDTPRGKVTFVNLVAKFGREQNAPSFLLCSHYDTKWFETFQFVGANDGGSSTGLLLELARVLSLRPNLAATVELVFFDGEEAYENFSATDGLYGSRYFAKDLAEKKRVGDFRGGLLFDMVGDRSLDITLPPDSPPQLALGIFAAADALKLRSHFTYFDRQILDDHTPLNSVGIPTLDLIDFNFPPWHTAGDTLDKLSAESLRIVGAVAVYYLSETTVK